MRNATGRTLTTLILAGALSGVPAGEISGEPATAPAASAAQRRERLSRFADGLLDARFRHEAVTGSFEVLSDSPEGTAASILAGNLEAVFAELESILTRVEGATPPAPGKVRAYLFASKRQYEALERAVSDRGGGRSAGMYFPDLGVLAFHSDVHSQPFARTVMIHECVHAYVDVRMRAAGHRLPAALEEGLAEYVGLSEVKRGRIRLGTYAAKTRYENPRQTRVLASIAASRLEEGRRAVRRREEMRSFASLFEAQPTSQGEGKVDDFYGVSWLLVDYLRHGDAEWKRLAFPKFLARVAAGEPPLPTLVDAYARPVAELERGFRAHVEAFELPVDRGKEAAR